MLPFEPSDLVRVEKLASKCWSLSFPRSNAQPVSMIPGDTVLLSLTGETKVKITNVNGVLMEECVLLPQ